MKWERKLYALVLGCLLVSAGIGVVIVTRTISDTSDTIYTSIIRVSDGVQNLFPNTLAGLKSAINGSNNDSSVVKMVSGSNLSVSSTIQLYDNVELDMNGAILFGAADVTIVYMHPGSKLHGGVINVSSVVFTKECINISGEDDHSWMKRTMVYDMFLKSSSQRGYGIHFFIPNTAGDHQIGFNYFDNIWTYEFDTSWFFDNRWATVGTGGWINGNQFSNLIGYGDRCFINMSNTVKLGTISSFTAIDGNVFMNINYQILAGVCDSFVSIDGDRNIFSNILIWYDFTFLNKSVFIRTGADNNVLMGGISDDVLDKGLYNTFYHSGSDGINISYMCTDRGGATGIKFYYSTTGNPLTYFYGYDTGSSSVKFGYLGVLTNGAFRVGSDTGENIWLSPSQGDHTKNVTIDNLLLIEPRATLPNSPSDGMMCYISGNDSLFLWDGAWHRLNP